MNSAVSRYKINIQKSVVFLYICNEQLEIEIKKTIPLIIVSKTVKYLGRNLTKDARNVYTEKHKVLLRVIKDNICNLKDSPCSYAGDLILLRLQYSPK